MQKPPCCQGGFFFVFYNQYILNNKSSHGTTPNIHIFVVKCVFSSGEPVVFSTHTPKFLFQFNRL